MNPPQRLTRKELLQAIARSRGSRVLVILVGVIVLTLVIAGLWQARAFMSLIAALFVAIIVVHAVGYMVSSKQRRRELDEDSRLARSYWSYAYRGLTWVGLGMVVGNLMAYWWSGRAPMGGIVAGSLACLVGLIAHIVWLSRQI